MGNLGGPWEVLGKYFVVSGRSLVGSLGGAQTTLLCVPREIVMLLRGLWGLVNMLKVSSGAAVDWQAVYDTGRSRLPLSS